MSWGNPTNLQEMIAARALSPLAWGYGVGAYLRLRAYQLGLPRKRLPVPVISVGNITCGGTGKTPVTIALAQQLVRAGMRPGILSRGYGRKRESALTIVSDGKGSLADFRCAGDEPCLIALALPEAVVVSCSNRVAAGMMAVEEMGVNVIILDDGFQHLPLRRDLDLVLIDYSDEPESDSLLPAGRLREPLVALGRASAFAITKVPAEPDPDRVEKLKALLRKLNPQAPIHLCQIAPSSLILAGGGEKPLSVLKGKNVAAFCAVAKSQPFFRSLEELGCRIVSRQSFPDHHTYSKKDHRKIISRAAKADLLLTTEKDLLKLTDFQTFDLDLGAVRLDVTWQGEAPDLTGFLPGASGGLAVSVPGSPSRSELDARAGSQTQ